MQENRSFDSYFGTYPGANGIPAGVCVPDPVNGGCDQPFHDPSDKNYGGPHGAGAARRHQRWQDGRLRRRGAGSAKMNCTRTIRMQRVQRCKQRRNPKQGNCIDVMGYHDAREIPNYWTYAQNFVLQDNMFESAASWSLPEHLFLVSGWSAVCPNGDAQPARLRELARPGTRQERTPLVQANAT